MEKARKQEEERKKQHVSIPLHPKLRDLILILYYCFQKDEELLRLEVEKKKLEEKLKEKENEKRNDLRSKSPQGIYHPFYSRV